MPNRILREGILTSERINALNWEAEVFYRRLMSVVDDFGRFTAHPSLLRAALYPLKLDTVRDANMERLLALVEQASLVRVYVVAGKRYLELLDFKQQVRAKESKYPHPPADDPQLRSGCVASAQQTQADAHLDGGGDEDVFDTSTHPNARAQEIGPDTRFSMRAAWRPSEHFKGIAKLAGLTQVDAEALGQGLGEFIAYWLTQPDTERSQHEWDHALIKSLKHDKLRGESPRKKRREEAPKETFRERDDRIARERYAEMTGKAPPGPAHANVIDITPQTPQLGAPQ